MARDLNAEYVSDFSGLLDSVYIDCGAHGIVDNYGDYKEDPEKTIDKNSPEFTKEARILIKEGSGRGIDRDIREKIVSCCHEGMRTDWQNAEAMESFYKKILSAKELIEKRLKKLSYESNARFIADFYKTIEPVGFTYAAHCEMEEFPNSKLMPIIIASSKEEFERNMEALLKKPEHETTDRLIKESINMYRRAALHANWENREQTETLYKQTLSEMDWLNQRLQSLK